jgi:general secretion pathway protein F
VTTFSYRAVDGTGRAVSGAVDATDLAAAERAILDMGLKPYQTRRDDQKTTWLTREIGGSVSTADRAKFVRMLASLMTAGVTIDRALSVLGSDEGNRRIQKMASVAAETVASGQPLSMAMAKAELGFGAAECGQARAGEQTGKLSASLQSLATELEHGAGLRDRIVSALVYPAVLLVMAVASLFVIATVLAPSLAPVFEQAGRDPPFLLQAVSFVAERIQWIAAGLAALGLLWIVLRINGTSLIPEKLKLSFTPLRQLEAARYCRTLGNLLQQGASLQVALRLTRDAMAYRTSARESEQVLERVTSGAKLFAAAEGLSFLDGTTRQLIRIGEETNQLPAMLAHAANAFETSTTQKIERLMTLLTPVLTILIGGMIGGLIMSVMRAIFSLNELALQ